MMPARDPRQIILASASIIRQQLLERAGLAVTALAARIDEESIRHALQAEAATPRDVADALAEMKARKLAEKHPQALVIGCDQVLEVDGMIFGKPDSPETARSQLRALRGKTHRLLSAVVVYDRGEPVWRHMGVVRLTMRDVSDAYLDDYLDRNWDSIRHAVGAYKLEEEGVRLFSVIDGDYFTVLGLPLLPLLNYLGQRGFIAA
jgi:septum formation protein